MVREIKDNIFGRHHKIDNLMNYATNEDFLWMNKYGDEIMNKTYRVEFEEEMYLANAMRYSKMIDEKHKKISLFINIFCVIMGFGFIYKWSVIDKRNNLAIPDYINGED